jgi:hypothetical protein
MTTMTKKELVRTTKSRYLKAIKKDKTKILDELVANIGWNRKYSIRVLGAGYEYQKVERVGRKSKTPVYGSETLLPAIKIWEMLDYPCGQRLQPVLKETAERLMAHGELKLTAKTKEKLYRVSAKTLDRRLKKEREIRCLPKNRGTTRHGSLLKSAIPIRINSWQDDEVGFMEMDTVAHNGGDPSGEFIYSLDMVEIVSGWSEQIAVMGKGQRNVVASLEIVRNDLPFKLRGVDSDGGSEFINWHMVKYCQARELYFTRSRPDRKNDNAHVEQKNYTHVRKLLGYGRLDTPEQLILMNDLYRNELRLFNNFFRPVMKIVAKEKINNSVCRKRYDQAQTPYQRLLAAGMLSEDKKAELRQLYLSLNPLQLKRRIEAKVLKIRHAQPAVFRQNLMMNKVTNYLSQPLPVTVTFLND